MKRSMSQQLSIGAVAPRMPRLSSWLRRPPPPLAQADGSFQSRRRSDGGDDASLQEISADSVEISAASVEPIRHIIPSARSVATPNSTRCCDMQRHALGRAIVDLLPRIITPAHRHRPHAHRLSDHLRFNQRVQRRRRPQQYVARVRDDHDRHLLLVEVLLRMFALESSSSARNGSIRSTSACPSSR